MPRYKDSPEVRAAKKKEKLREFLSLLDVEDMSDLKSVFKEMVGEILENGLEAELDDEPGYTRYDYRNKGTENIRNGHSRKTMKTGAGNAIENFNRQLRKVTKSKAVFPNNDSLLKMLYLAQVDITRKWTGRCRDWGEIHSQPGIFLVDRLPQWQKSQFLSRVK